MKWYQYFTLIFLLCSGNLFSQINLKEMVFCHDQTNALRFVSSDKYQLSFSSQKIETFQLKNGAMSYDLEKNLVQFFEKGELIITVEMQKSGIVTVSDLRKDKIYTRTPVNENSTCISQPNNFEDIFEDSVNIGFVYSYCRLVGVSVTIVNFGSVNLYPLQKIGSKNFSWDFLYSATARYTAKDYICVKILTDRKSAKPDFISITDEINIERFKRTSGIEITGVTNKANNFTKITLVTRKINSNAFEFHDILKYTKKGKLIEHDEEIAITNCN
ncbi:MAG: hypothetical protein WBP16_08230 [Ferruginibacter sp.]